MVSLMRVLGEIGSLGCATSRCENISAYFSAFCPTALLFCLLLRLSTNSPANISDCKATSLLMIKHDSIHPLLLSAGKKCRPLLTRWQYPLGSLTQSLTIIQECDEICGYGLKQIECSLQDTLLFVIAPDGGLLSLPIQIAI